MSFVSIILFLKRYFLPPSVYLKYNTLIAASAMEQEQNKEKQHHCLMQAMLILHQVNLLKFKNVIQSQNTVSINFIEILIYNILYQIFINIDICLSIYIFFYF